MSENASGGRRRKAPVEEGAPAKGPTKRVVLKRERVLVLPDSLTGEALDTTLKDIAKAVGKRAGAQVVSEAWVVVGEFEGASKDHAIEAHAGKPGTADAIPGAYKAPTVSAWAGGALYEAPPQPLVQRKALV